MKIPNPFSPPPAPPAFGGGRVMPEHTTYNPLSRILFGWLTPFLSAGFSRPLEKDDFWVLPDDHLASKITDDVEKNFYARCSPEKRPLHLKGELRREDETDDMGPIDVGNVEESGDRAEAKHASATASKARRYNESLFRALHQTFFRKMWIAGFLRLFADTLKTTAPLVNKVLLQWLTDSYSFRHTPEAERSTAVQAGLLTQPRGIGFGIGLAFALFVMQEAATLVRTVETFDVLSTNPPYALQMMNHYLQLSATGGLLVRTGLIGSIFRKAVRISGRGRAHHSVGQITTMISTDVTRLDRFMQFAHVVWIAPVQLIIGIGLLIGNLGYSALVGLGVLIAGFPLQVVIVRIMFKQRTKGIKFTDQRVRLTTEVLQGIRLLKYFAWEGFYMNEVIGLRKKEIKTIKAMTIARATIISMMTFIPILAAVLSFITYALTGHDLNVAVIFASLQLFNIIRLPLLQFPFVVSALSDSLVALRRIGTFLTAEDLPRPYDIKGDTDGIAVTVDGDFTWETVGKASNDTKSSGVKKGEKLGTTLPHHSVSEKGTTSGQEGKIVEVEEQPFQLKSMKLAVPKGAFAGIVGRVGSGKSSLLQALIGEMRKTRGKVVFGGSTAYSPQSPWIRNATLRENILFGQDDEEERFRRVVKACSLEHDIKVLPNGELTEIGEKGINLSGGQKARVSLARCAYSRSDIVLLDDPLSAVDAYVGKAILHDCLLKGPLADRTRILVTHSLHVLDKLDYIYVMDQGQIVEQGTYADLMDNSDLFSKLIEEYGNADSDSEGGDTTDDRDDARSPEITSLKPAAVPKDESEKVSHRGNLEKTGGKVSALMQVEERATGAVTWRIYKSYMRFAGGLYWAPWILLMLVLAQGAAVGNALFLGFWTAESVPGFRQGHYIAVYAGLGVGQAIFTFFVILSFTIACLTASLGLFTSAFSGVLRSPISFFDTTPMGRILSRLSKDQDTLDTEMSMNMFQFSNTLFSVFGTVALVFYTFPYLGIIFIPLVLLYQLVSVYYRRTSVEVKRWDSLLRSLLYASYSESLTGLSTIRAFREQSRSIRDAEHGVDMQNRAYYMIISIQRWLSVRLDLFGNVLVLGICLFAAGFRTSVDPAKIGVVLSYTLSITQTFSEMVSQFAANEQNMNAVERVLHYSDLPSEGDPRSPQLDPGPEWPRQGVIRFKDVQMAYREGLPLVLKGVSFDIRPGEKVGIVGRTGAGKSSLLQVLFRMVEVQRGNIEIDGVDTKDIGLETLRSRLALVPQDSILFLGTLRDNLDPQRLRTDAELISVLQRAWLLPRNGAKDPVAEAKFSLDANIGDEGSNFSAGEKQLLALCRALVKNSRVIVLDEATSSVDVETDSKLQKTIQTEFTQSTLLSYYDRIMVMDDGRVAEFDTVLSLYDREDSIFRSLCDEAKLQRADILRIRSENASN